ncbi:aprataxin-related [Holotrichia oblita]|uniref:Aprataxin-related n=1 Tax=Holotrichia oblita TaxID=644536 RepID=A0ACB9TX13_HOLOL|nr:aprataxin-related [Holotrichia oblita]
MENSKCIFCKIVARQQSAKIFYEDDDILVFEDIKPASQHHYLVIPKHHIKGANYLTKNDLPLLMKMIDVGKSVLSQNNGNVDDMRLGFHWPPFNSISHLHLHVISPTSEMGFITSQIYKPDTLWFVTADYMIKRLESAKL